MNQSEAGLGQHGRDEPGDAATTSRPMRTVPPSALRSSIKSAIAVGVFSTLRSIWMMPSPSMAATQWMSLAISMPTLMRILPSKR
ncbi:hypothetical protein QO004_002790 [Rhizobium mesoamericanum]|nr:hypothetical protein [Rhizobium mesoamericanum]